MHYIEFFMFCQVINFANSNIAVPVIAALDNIAIQKPNEYIDTNIGKNIRLIKTNILFEN